MTLGGRSRHQISQVFEDTERRNGYRAPAIKCHVMEEALLARASRISGPHQVAQLIAGLRYFLRAHLPYVEIGSELNRRTIGAAQGRITGASNTGKPASLQPA